jgi:plasmid maintenance system antidote protein VapI
MVLRRHRLNAGHTLVSASKVLGVHMHTLLRWEKGKHSIPADMLFKIQNLFSLSNEEVLALAKKETV